MIDTPLDPRHARLVALLYDELPPAEARALRDELARDPELRSAWAELEGTRRLLGGWDIEEATPSFVFVEPPAAPTALHPTTAPELVRSGGDARRRALPSLSLGRMAALSGWALAAGAFLVFGLAGKGLRVDRLNDGFSVRLGRTALQEPVGPASTGPASRLLSDSRFGFHPAASLTSVAAGADSFVTAGELEAHTEQLMELFARVIRDDRARQQQEFRSLVRGVFDGLNEHQYAGYRDLRGRIEAVDVGLKLGQPGEVRRADGTTAPAIVDTLPATQSYPRQPRQRGWRLGDFPNEPERP